MNRVRIIQRTNGAGPYYILQYYSMVDNSWVSAYSHRIKDRLIMYMYLVYTYSFKQSRVYPHILTTNSKEIHQLIRDHMTQIIDHVKSTP